MTDVDKQEIDILSQQDYAETPYNDSTYEVVGDPPEEERFVPMQMHVLPQTQKYIDPMFADYGGVQGGDDAVRWHLPKELAQTAPPSARSSVGQQEDLEEAMAQQHAAEIEAAKQEAFMAGKMEGLEEAVQANNDKLAGMEQRISEVINDLQQQLSQQVALVEQQALDLSLMLSKKLVDSAVELNPEYIIPLIKEAIAHAGTAQIQQVRVSTADYEFIRVVGLEKSMVGRNENWKFVPDETLNAGCIVDTSAGEIDFDLEASWERISDKAMTVKR